MKIKLLAGTSLIEILTATGVISIGSIVLLQGFIQASRLSTRNATTGQGLHILNTQVDTDARKDYALFGGDGTTEEIPITQLPNAKITRTITCTTAKTKVHDPTCNVAESYKTLHYVMTWEGADGAHTLKADYILVNAGLLNGEGEVPGNAFQPLPCSYGAQGQPQYDFGYGCQPTVLPTIDPTDDPTDSPCGGDGYEGCVPGDCTTDPNAICDDPSPTVDPSSDIPSPTPDPTAEPEECTPENWQWWCGFI